ncbi:hypothetical protein C8R41DRAFT_809756 [Lentinula lateritia]|uniref:Uncharacterized protein n=1 Tax=Lentinula lateritia TaxID=40482 RepID=A0ABQ8VVY8_9AGAR|nr:hypothetical protein C8R41DRAFT_856128 [Lentinula lateritia]KAJ4500484.1 hypothetical protein C8R41DRAFT_809756 [Lentinula lateritia]
MANLCYSQLCSQLCPFLFLIIGGTASFSISSILSSQKSQTHHHSAGLHMFQHWGLEVEEDNGLVQKCSQDLPLYCIL